jgi:hypothetical protein
MAQEADEYRKFVFWYFLSGARKDMKSYLISIKIVLIIKEQCHLETFVFTSFLLYGSKSHAQEIGNYVFLLLASVLFFLTSDFFLYANKFNWFH